MTADHPSGERRPISKRLRYEVFRRDDFTCRYCGAKPTERELRVDHVVPVTLGGDNDPSNLATSCVDCNAGKSSTAPDSPIVEGVSDDALRWGEAMKQAAKTQSASKKKGSRQVAKIDAKWCEYGNGLDGGPIKRPSDWKATANQFLNAGLTVKDLNELIEQTMEKRNVKDCWRYFCGCGWNLLRERQAIAAALLEVEEDGE